MSDFEVTDEQVEAGAQAHRDLIAAWGRGEANCDHEDVARAVLAAVGPLIAAGALREAADYLDADRGGNSASYKLRNRAIRIKRGDA